MLFPRVILLIYCFHRVLTVELNIRKSVTEVRENYSGSNSLVYLFKNDEYENLVADSISWSGTAFLRQEISDSINSMKDSLVTVKRCTMCDCQLIQAKIIDLDTMLLENLDTGTYFYAEGDIIEYITKRPRDGSTKLKFLFGRRDYDGILSYLIRGITWLPNYDLSIINSETCNLQGYAVIRNTQHQEYQVDHTSLFSGDLQLVNVRSSPQLRASDKAANPNYNSSSKSIELIGEEKGIYFYSLSTPYTLRPLSSVRLPFIRLIPLCQFYYKATVNIRNGEYKGIFQRYYELISDEFLPAGVVTIRDNQILMGQAKLPDIPQNFTQKITLGQDSDVRYLIRGNLTSSNVVKTKVNSRTFELDVTISNFKNKPISGLLEFRGSTRLILHETTCLSGKIDGNMFVVSVNLASKEIYQCQFNITLK